MQIKSIFFYVILLMLSLVTVNSSTFAQTKINEVLASNQLAFFDDLNDIFLSNHHIHQTHQLKNYRFWP